MTVAALVASRDGGAKSGERAAAEKRLTDAAGIAPDAMVEAINEAQAQRAAAQAELQGAPAPTTDTDAEVCATIDSLGDVGAALKDAKPESLERLHRELVLN